MGTLNFENLAQLEEDTHADALAALREQNKTTHAIMRREFTHDALYDYIIHELDRFADSCDEIGFKLEAIRARQASAWFHRTAVRAGY